jgi:hypothetical protein
MTAAAPRRGRHVHLRPLDSEVVRALGPLVNDPAATAGWRTGGRYVPADRLEGLLTTDIALSCGIYTDLDDPPVGLVEMSASDLPHGHGHLSLLVAPSHQLTGLATEATILFMDECFWRLDLRTIYLLMAADVRHRATSGMDRLVEVCGVLPEHIRMNGGFVDVTIGRVTRSQFIDKVVTSRPLTMLSPEGWCCAPS